MADAFTSNLNLNQQEVGAHNNTWGTIANTNFGYIDSKLGDRTSIATTGGSTTLSETEQKVQKIKITGALVSNATINFNATGGLWAIENATTGDFDVTVKVTGQTGFTVGRGEKVAGAYNGTDLERIGLGPIAPIALTDAASVAVDLALVRDGGAFSLTAAGNRTLATPSNLVAGKKFLVYHTASGADRTLALSAGYGFGTDIASLSATTSGKTDILGFIYNSTLAKSLLVGVEKGYS